MLVYYKGRVIISGDKKIKAKYLFKSDGEESKVKIGLSVASKKGNSVWRNRIKRILREEIRSDERILSEIVEQNKASLLIIFTPHSINQTNSNKIFQKDLKASVLNILIRLKTEPMPVG